MGLRQCNKCSEMVDEAKAFCPGCGNAFVEEESREATTFEKLDHTVEFGQTMYSQMLEDMGLKISDAPDLAEKRVEMITSIKKEITVSPVKTTESSTAKPAENIPDPPKSTLNLKLYIFGGLSVLVLLVIAVASAIMVILDIWSRLLR